MRDIEMSYGKYVVIYLILIMVLIAVFVISIAVGSVKISIWEVIDIILNKVQDDSVNSTIVWKIRLPRALASMIGGAAIAVAGLLFQIFFRNPIVDSYILGVSSGSTLFIALLMLGGVTFGFSTLSPYTLFIGAFLGAICVTAIILIVAYKVRDIATLLIIGLMIGYLCTAVTNILKTFAENEKLKEFIIWTMGSFSGFTWDQLKIMTIIVIPFLFGAFMISKPLNAFLLGEEYAKSMGVNIKFFRICIILVSSVLTAAVTAFAGPVAFIGMSVPHIARLSLRTSDNRMLVPLSILFGGTITVLCDLIARTLLAPAELTISSVTSFFGVPIVIWLLLKRRTKL
ncbi:FecCD family ABC transporter permease [Lutispora thermophila]|uniref:Iron complex transport system permease protein n=1 Tax=Lutispora thermophila DSM 19022 TaxID=1122184 RepID=A0A1M6H9C7_9FIRM|nr:iron ABC transporter permease [Lutispora thermophila]SHJ18801.1 iron complex transport system permease protein [Lutispora thermophila DSM 19022]